MRVINIFLLLTVTVCFVFCNNASSSATTLGKGDAPEQTKESLGTQWTPVALNTADETVSAFVTTKKGRLIAGTSAGPYISDDKGTTWKQANINPDNKSAVFSLAIDNSGIIYAGLTKYGVLVSTDNGDSWILYNTGLKMGGPRSSYAMLASGNNILKGTLESGVYISIDKGQSWNPSNNGIPLNLINNRMVSVTQLVQNANTVYALTDLGVRYSKDNGKTWSKPAHNGINRLGYMSSLAVSNNNLYTGITESQKGVFVSNDNGENWKATGLQGKATNALFTTSSGNIYAGADGEVYRSVDNGQTWTVVGKGLPTGAVIYSIGITPDGKLLVGLNRKGIYLLK
jgi:photosystem II stability/assembly factor-like uncharacterized protein